MMDVEGKLWTTFFGGVILALFTIAALVIINLAQPKEFNGYYLAHSSTTKEPTIFINWENRIDECVFRSYDQERLLETLERLQTAGDPTK